MRSFYLMLLAIATATAGYCQTQDSYEYQSEFIWGINKNTAGGLIGGFVFKKSRKVNERMLETFGLEIMNVKHPQEIRRNAQTGNFFVLGKSNYLYAFRFQYGRDFILFKKAPQKGVEIKAVFAAGPSLGIVAPYYVEWAPSGSGGIFFTRRDQYDPKLIEPGEILGTGRLFEGLGESDLVLGGNLKAAFNFELGIIKSQVTGFEVGFLVDAYSKPIELMPGLEKYSVYPTLFITLFYGSRK